MQYFGLNFVEAHQALAVVWAKQEEMGIKRTPFHVDAEGLDASIYTEHEEGEKLFRETLVSLCIPFVEGDEPQVRPKGFGVG